MADLDGLLRTLMPRIGRLVLVDVEYARAMSAAERSWVRALCQDVRKRPLTWDSKAILAVLRKAAQPVRGSSPAEPLVPAVGR